MVNDISNKGGTDEARTTSDEDSFAHKKKLYLFRCSGTFINHERIK